MTWFSRDWERAIAGAALAVVCVAVTWGVVARYVAPRPAAWTNELATIGFAWVVFPGAAAGMKRGLHIGVDLVTALLPPSMQRLIAIAVSLFLALALAYVAWLAIQLGIKSWSRPTPVMRLPSSVVHAAAVLGFASMAVQSLLKALDIVRDEA